VSAPEGREKKKFLSFRAGGRAAKRETYSFEGVYPFYEAIQERRERSETKPGKEENLFHRSVKRGERASTILKKKRRRICPTGEK